MMKKSFLSMLICLILCLALLPAAAMAEGSGAVEACWGTSYGETAKLGSGTLQQALDAAAADSQVSYIWLKKDITNAEYTISAGNFIFDQDTYEVSAAPGKNAFTVTDTAHVVFDLFGTLEGGASCIYVNGEDAEVILESTSTFAAVPGMPAVVLEAGRLEVEHSTFDGPGRLCDILYKGGTLDLTDDFAPITVTNASGSDVLVNADYGNSIRLNPAATLNVMGLPVSVLANSETGVRRGSVTVQFDANGGTGEMASVTLDSALYVLPECEFTAPAGKLFKSWTILFADNSEGTGYAPTAQMSIYENVTMRPEWKDKPIVTFDANGGSGVMTSVTLEDTAYIFPECEFTAPAGKIFKCWTVVYANGEKLTGCKPGNGEDVSEHVTLYAEWMDKPIVTFDGNGGTGVMSPETLDEAEYLIPECEFTAPAGKIFGGWTVVTADEERSYYYPGERLWPEESLTLRAEWKDMPTVTFDGNGGSGVMSPETLDETWYLIPECKFIAPAGKMFKSWTIVYPSGSVDTGYLPTESEWLTESVTLRAEWMDVVIITFDANGGSGTMVPVTLEEAFYQFPKCQFTAPAGKMFKCWTIVYADGEEETDRMPDSSHSMYESVTLRAEWTDAITATFDANGGSGTMAPVVLEEAWYMAPECEFTAPAGKVFDSWTIVYADGSEATDYPNGTYIYVEENMTLRAEWTDPYIITFDANGGSGVMADVITGPVSYEIPACGFTAPAGKMFIGWTIITADEESSYYNPGAYKWLDENATLRAEWAKKPTITFEANEGKGVMNAVTLNGTRYEAPECGFTAPEGLRFAQWECRNADGEFLNTYLPGEIFEVREDVVLSAQWVIAQVWINGDLPLENGQYVDNSGKISTTRPSGGYVYYHNGVMTLHNFKGSSIELYASDVTMVLEGVNELNSSNGSEPIDPLLAVSSDVVIQGSGSLKINSKGYELDGFDLQGGKLTIKSGKIDIEAGEDGVWSYGGDLSVTGGELSIKAKDDGIDVEHGDVSITGGTAKMDAEDDGIYLFEGDLTIDGGKVTVISEEDDGMDVEDGNLTIKNGQITIQADDHGLDINDIEKPGTGKTFISGGTLTINAGDDGFDCGNLILITGGTLNVQAKDIAVDTDGELDIRGGKLVLFAGEGGLEGEVVKIGNPDLNVTVSKADGVAVFAFEKLIISGDQYVVIPCRNPYSGLGYCLADASGEILKAAIFVAKEVVLPQTGDRTPLVLLTALLALSACGMTLLRKKRA